jgi:hypothetical protein
LWVAFISAATVQAAPKPGANQADTDPAVRNAVNFHLLDFVGWNNRDWTVFRHLHTADVKVEMGDMKTQGLDQHVAAMEGMLKQMPESRVVQHTPTVAQGEWTCVVGKGPGITMATVAKWRDGAISEEYLFMREVPAGKPAPKLKGAPLVKISNQGDTRALTGAEPGWSCVYGRGEDGKAFVTFTRTEKGKETQRMVFAN